MTNFPLKEKMLVTCALPYANGAAHLGHLRTYIPGDVFVRFLRKIGQDVLFVCGSDTHGTPIVVNAEKEKITPKQLVEKYHQHFQKVFSRLNMSFDFYGSTDSPENHARTQEILTKLDKAGYIYEKEIDEAYCEKCKKYLPDRYLAGICPYCGAEARGDECDLGCGRFLETGELKEPKCKICGTVPKMVKRTHKFFKLTAFDKFLKEYLPTLEGTKVARNYALGWVKGGLKDWCITRDIDWGIKFPGTDLIVYVWVDAPIGYIAATEEWAKKNKKDWKAYWQDSAKIVHFIGSGITYHHCIFWPAMLKGAGYTLPWSVAASGMLTIEGNKFSKSRGNVVWVEEDYLDKGFSADALRYYTVACSPHTNDLDFSWRMFQDKVNKDLSDVLGNFVHRICLFSWDGFKGKMKGKAEKKVLDKIRDTENGLRNAIGDYDFKRAADTVISLAAYGNETFQGCEPWKSKGTSECEQAVVNGLQIVKALAIFMEPFTPAAAERIWSQIGEKDVHSAKIEEAYAPAKGVVKKPEVIFPKIEDKQREEAEKVLAGRMKKADIKTTFSVKYDEFAKLDLRVAEIKSAEKVPGADKLYKLKVDCGGERTIVAGIAKYYDANELLGKKVVIVANLEPATIRGVKSEGMLLAAEEGDKLVLITVDKEIKPGAKLH